MQEPGLASNSDATPAPTGVERSADALLVAHDLALGFLAKDGLEREGLAPLQAGGQIDYRWRVIMRGVRVGLLIADAKNPELSVARHILDVIRHAFAATLVGVPPADVDLVLHVGGRNFGLASLRVTHSTKATAAVKPYCWHHFTVTDLATPMENANA